MRQRIRLVGVSPEIEGREWQGVDYLRVGRNQRSQVQLDDTSISRCHAELSFVEPHGWFVQDLGSINGTYLNGVRLGSADHKIEERDLLQVGNMVLRVVRMDQPDMTTLESFTGTMQVEATTHNNNWDEAFEVVAGHVERRSCTGSQFVGLLRVGHDLHQHNSLDDLLQNSLGDAMRLLRARSAALVLVDELTGDLTLKAIAPEASEKPATARFSNTLARRCLARGESLLSHDTRKAVEFGRADGTTQGSMRSVLCALLRSPRKRLGVLHLDRGPMDKPFTVVDLHMADAIAASIARSIESVQFFLTKQRRWFLQTVIALAQTIELRDPGTAGHGKRVTMYALHLAKALKRSSPELRQIEIGSRLHDIGKIGIRDAVLRKTSRLSAAEYDHMQSHTVKGAAILASIPELAPILPIVRNHHERWDGRGYPDKLVAREIPLASRIVAVADSFDAMTSTRPYRARLSIDEAFAQIRDAAGTQFDPECSRAFFDLRHDIAKMVPQRSPAPADETAPFEVPADLDAECVLR